MLNTTEPKDVQSAHRFFRSSDKAATMKAEGYTVEPIDIPDAVFVRKPDTNLGYWGDGYAVDLRSGKCKCPDYEKHGGFCKHTIFVQMEMDEATCREYERCHEAA